jgi:hypothetical protein
MGKMGCPKGIQNSENSCKIFKENCTQILKKIKKNITNKKATIW